MKTLLLFKSSLGTIQAHRGRSILTVLGIMIGIASIIITFSIGRGAEEKIKSTILWMGEGACYVVSGNVLRRGSARESIFKPTRLTVQDMEAIRAQVPGIQEISRSTFTLQMFEYQGNATRDRVLGTDANILKINKNKLKMGQVFTPQQVIDRVNVVIIGEKIAQKLFKQEMPLGKTIRIEGNPFVVIGVIEHQEHFFGPDDPNSRAFMPYTVAKKYFAKENESEDDLNAIALSFYPNVSSEKPIRQIRRILRLRHNLEIGDDDDFTIFDEETIAKSAQEASYVIKLFGLLAASISLIVGGIGVMNIMLVSVNERMQEIGLRMALGATPLLVQAQFLIESIALCTIGGFMGIFLGLVGIWIIGYATTLPSIIEILPLLLSFFVTILTGIFFGYYPARLAALLNPIDALTER